MFILLLHVLLPSGKLPVHNLFPTSSFLPENGETSEGPLAMLFPLFWLPASQKLYINNSLTSNLSEISCFQIELQLCRMLSLATSLKLNKAKSRCIMDFVIVLIGSPSLSHTVKAQNHYMPLIWQRFLPLKILLYHIVQNHYTELFDAANNPVDTGHLCMLSGKEAS